MNRWLLLITVAFGLAAGGILALNSDAKSRAIDKVHYVQSQEYSDSMIGFVAFSRMNKHAVYADNFPTNVSELGIYMNLMNPYEKTGKPESLENSAYAEYHARLKQLAHTYKATPEYFHTLEKAFANKKYDEDPITDLPIGPLRKMHQHRLELTELAANSNLTIIKFIDENPHLPYNIIHKGEQQSKAWHAWRKEKDAYMYRLLRP